MSTASPTPPFEITAQARFAREAAAAGRLGWHPNVVQVHNRGVTTTGQPYLVQEFLEGGSLGARIREEGPLSWPVVLAVGIEVAAALDAAHDAGLLHRDVKPDNILFDRQGRAKLADFGIAGVSDSSLTASGVLTASIAYAAPELFAGQSPTPASDVYSLGATLYAALSGRRPFQGESDDNIVAVVMRATNEPLPDLRPLGVPDQVAELVERATAKDPADRYRTAAHISDALTALLAADPTEGAATGADEDRLADSATVLRPVAQARTIEVAPTAVRAMGEAQDDIALLSEDPAWPSRSWSGGRRRRNSRSGPGTTWPRTPGS